MIKDIEDDKEILINKILNTKPEMSLWHDLEKLNVCIVETGLVDSFEWKENSVRESSSAILKMLERMLFLDFLTINVYITRLTLEDCSIIEIKSLKDYDKSRSIGELFEYSYISERVGWGKELKYVYSKIMLIDFILSCENIYGGDQIIKRVGLREVK